MKNILLILMLLFLYATPVYAQLRLIFAGGCYHMLSSPIAYNEVGNFPLGISFEHDGKEIALATYLDSYYYRSYAAWVTEKVLDINLMEFRLGAVITYKQLNYQGLKGLVCSPLPVLRFNMDPFGIDLMVTPAEGGAVLMGTGSIKL